jgi:hypothetical protein
MNRSAPFSLPIDGMVVSMAHGQDKHQYLLIPSLVDQAEASGGELDPGAIGRAPQLVDVASGTP